MKDNPVIKFTLLFSAGILLSKYFTIPFDFLLLSFIPLSAGLIILIFIKKNQNVQLILLALLIIIAGAANSTIRLNQIAKTALPFHDLKNTKVWCEIDRVLLDNDGVLHFLVTTDSLLINKSVRQQNFEMILQIKSKSSRLGMLYDNAGSGDKLVFTGDVKEPSGIRNPGGFNYREFLSQKSVSATGYAKLENVKLLKSGNYSFANTLFSIRKSIDRRISELHGTKASAFLRGVLLADRSDISPEIREAFTNSGIVHILAVSGLHVGYIILIFYLLTARLNIHLRYVFILAGILFFLLITGMPVSAVRASLMAVILLAANYFDRGYNPVNSLALAVLLILIYDPSEMFTAGFQFSVSSVFSILFFYPLFVNWLKSKNIRNKYVRIFLLFISISLFAQLGSLPFTIAYFHKVPVVSIAANIFAIPLAGLIIANAFITLIISVVSTNIAITFASVNDLFVNFLFWIGNLFGNLKIAYLTVSGSKFTEGILYLLIIFPGIAHLLKDHLLKMKVLVSVLLLFNITFLFGFSGDQIPEDGKLSILAIDVGQGDSFLIKFPNGKTALVDAGNSTPAFDNGKRTIIPLLQFCGINKLDYLFISHVDADHYKGSLSLIGNGLVDTVYFPEPDPSVRKEVSFLEFLKNHKKIIRYYSGGEIYCGNAKIYFLKCPEISNFDSNNRSGIIKLCFGNTSALFTGDAEIKLEKELISRFGKFLDSDVLKVGHHGSRHGTGKPFLQWVTPEYSIISAGKNNLYHHPTPDVIRNLEEINTNICRTDYEGAVLLESDGKHFSKINWRER